ncbi:hypothetical protein [Methylobacterium organophilum]|uniref:DUF2946 domain-containing protein n=1 Tax=Methylobacterium organophilum TaxID=410 RepID=A0ABQ4T3U7_METOR|nr:hypothetical protein [Methylobacterium organophilum]GJE25661.1 hypothetical protein LKMONMHP_0499 [Methylobacterium organophilum]
MALRALALVLALAIAAPMTGLAQDIAFHQDLAFHEGHAHGQGLVTTEAGPAESPSVDPGIASHAHCGCHLVATLDSGGTVPMPAATRRYATAAALEPASADPVLPARPPRA